MNTLNLGVIGNGTIAALVDGRGAITWCCLPRLDGDPVFCAQLDGQRAAEPNPDDKGVFDFVLTRQASAAQSYLPNSAILRTVLTDEDGGAVEIIDFTPRFHNLGRTYRPPTIIRRVRPLSGLPRLTIRLRPRFGYGAETPQITRGSNHIRYVSAAQTVRLTTDAPAAYVLEERPFLVDRPLSFILGPDEPVQGGVDTTARDQFERTLDHWRSWVRSLSIPFEWQDAVIRAAITLKLCNFEETGAIVAALTTSIPEAPGTQRNWDYRFCWLRDAYFVVHALNRLGATRTMEDYLGFIANVVEDAADSALRPVYGVARASDIDEREAPALSGYRGFGPVRIGNQAHLQQQNDVYGSVVLAATHVFFDSRLARPGNLHLFRQLESLGVKAVASYDQPDAGPWELRTKAHVHTFSAVTCWAACDRLAKIAAVLGRADRAEHWRAEADRLHAGICARAWNPTLNSFVSAFDGDEMDATLLLLHELDFLEADDPRFAATVARVEEKLRNGDTLYRYVSEDDFGRPETAFVICVFWLIDALAALGRRDEARRLFESMLARRNPLGLLSEDIDSVTGELWGNFPQTYSMVGLINAAVRLSRSWEEAF